MLWTLPAPVRSLCVSQSQVQSHCSRLRCSISTASAVKRAEPLSILFCGSDDFSIESLRALSHARQDTPALIHDIHVAHRPAKPTGRGLKTLRQVPISHTATALSLPTHTLDTFTGWTPPFSYNLVVAVSFGLLVPPRILARAKYGGLNVHPSLLPDLRGSAPIEHAILKQREYTGVSVQTLHPSKFDEGVVLAQTASPGLLIGRDETAHELAVRLAPIGADMLVSVLRERSFVPPLEDAGWYHADADADADADARTEYAPKITKQDRFIDFSAMNRSQILAVQRALGDTWCLLPNGDRLVVHELVPLDTPVTSTAASEQAGLSYDEASRELLFRAACGRVGILKSTTYPGGKAGKGNAKAAKILKQQR